MNEYRCERCGETFVDETVLDGQTRVEHLVREDGEYCGGDGKLAREVTQ